ncbi:hypothetical protein L1887_12003 [Cichorium endivia]|nr:hypothetical protein L1887_12003 [Cichorium endivia]
MVESQSPTARGNHDSQTKQVQEVAADYDHLPEGYIRKEDEEYGCVNNSGASSPMSEEVPVIDISLLNSSLSELNKLKSAVSSWGCFQAINHGIEGSFLEKIREISKLFFKLSMEEKKKYLRAENDVEGYGNDMFLTEKQILDWNDRLYLNVLPRQQRRLQFWPQNPTHFRTASWIKYGTTATMDARFSYYPPCPWPERVFGLKPHADFSALTFLLQDKEVEGLQVLKDGKWVGVPIVRDALTINIGDQLEVMSNGVFKSPMHRVMINSRDARMTVAMFCMPQTEKDIGPVNGLVSEERPRLYKNVTVDVRTFFTYLQKGTRGIDALKI